MAKKTVLVVDDEELMREILIDALSDEFNVLAASNGEEALAICEQCRDKGDAIDLVITDLIMPKMRGDALAEKVREICPSLPIIFISGYEREIQMRALLERGNVAFLQKPFDIESLAFAVREALG